MTIMEALGGHSGETIMESLGGHNGETIAQVIEETGLTPVTPDPKPEPTVFTVTYNVNGGTGTIDAAKVEEGKSITLNDGSTLTAPEGKEFGGWGLTDTAIEAVKSPFTPEDDTILYAIWSDVQAAIGSGTDDSGD